MATGIFSTVRVAGEGIALALVGAGLVGLLAWRLQDLLPAAVAIGTGTPDVQQAAQRLATGDMAGALALLPASPLPPCWRPTARLSAGCSTFWRPSPWPRPWRVFAFLSAGRGGSDA